MAIPRLHLVVIALCALAGIAGVYVATPWLHYVFKPGTTLVIAALVLRAPESERGYRTAILAGLAFSTLGDVFLMLPGDRFVFGLASFLVAHVAYLFAFTRRASFVAVRWPFFAYGALAAAVAGILWPNLPDALRPPVAVYVVVLAAMAAQAAAAWRRGPSTATACAALGGAFFVASDAMLAIDRFVSPFAAARASVLATYWIAQTLIALSALSPLPHKLVGERVG